MARVSNKVTLLRTPKGEQGQDGIVVTVTPPDIVHREGEGKTYNIYVDVRKGAAQVNYGDYGCSLLGSSGPGALADNIRWSFGTEDGRFFYRVMIASEATGVNLTVPFTVTCGDIDCAMSFHIVTVADGVPGKQGPLPRGPRVWADIPDGEILYDGTTSEGIRDIVRHAGYYWACAATHAKGSAHEPSEPSTDWKRFQSWDLVATQILLADNAVIENGVIRNLKTDIGGKRVEITHDSNDICVYDSGGKLCTRMSGETMTHAALFGDGGDLDPSSLGSLASPVCAVTYTSASEGSSATENTYTLGTVAAGAGLLSGVISASVQVSQSLTPVTSSGGTGSGGITVDPTFRRYPAMTVRVRVNGTTVATLELNQMNSTQGVSTVEAPFSVHSSGPSVKITVEVTSSGYMGYTGSWTARPFVKASGLRLDNAKNVSYLFENGLATGASTANYLEAFTDPDGVMAIKGRSGEAGFMCYRDSLYLRIGGAWRRLGVSGSALTLTACAEPNIETT